MRVLAFIPARGGSRGIPRKNLALLAGRPLIDYSLRAAKAATSVTDIFVSTDDEEIAAVCETLGTKVPYRRPPELAGDKASTMDALFHGLDWWCAEQGTSPDLILLLQPTSPLRGADDIDSMVAHLAATGAEAAVSVHPVREHPMECLQKQGTGWRMLVSPPVGAQQRQDYDGGYFFINGALYAATPDFLRRHRNFLVAGETLLHEMSAERGVDIDEPCDLDLADAMLSHPRLKARLGIL